MPRRLHTAWDMQEKDWLNSITQQVIGAAIAFELLQAGLSIERQRPLPLMYRGAQVLSYLRLSGCRVGLLINFNVKWLTQDGVKRIVNGFAD